MAIKGWTFAGLGAVAITLAACSTPMDPDAVPAANQRLALKTDICLTRFRQKEFNSAKELAGCLLPAQRQMMVEIELRDMSIFDVYAARVNLIAENVDSGQMTADEGAQQYGAAQTQLANTIIATYQADQAHRAEARAVAAAFGAGLQNAGRSMQAQNQQINCTSTPFGRSVNTTCY